MQGPWIDDGNGPVRNPTLSDAEFNAALTAMQVNNLISLWTHASNQEIKYISGSAPTMMILGVLTGKPKSLACKTWIFAIWNLYYNRKPSVTAEPNPTLEDFSSVGAMPYSVPEILAEGAQALVELQTLITAMKAHLGL